MGFNLGGIGDILSSVGSGLGGKDSFLGNLAPIGLLGALQYLSASGAAHDARQTATANREFSAAEAEKQRAFEASLFEKKAALEAQLAAINAKIQKGGLVNSAYTNATNTQLQGGQMQMQSLNNMLQGVQRGLGGV